MVTTLNNCCFCASLRTGTIIIGWLYEVYFMVALATNITVRFGGQASTINETANGSWLIILTSAIQMGIAIVLLYGVYANHKRSVHSFVWCESFFIAVNIITLLFNIISLGLTLVDALYVILVASIVFLIQIYSVFVVYSFYKETYG
ncbi:uncharacterized protein LOC129001856 [Macrosteles quadrilineatus]|uniref:uncharacterized protein LOC129001856 n=1 Tax=Macrosteles quadrilineatus TaxID=74068 RepID=UPI0023E253D2|nr:uncharacterized protein LOC129001856 [Macrosteles quadrilineatus]XP_054285288.1 uncharacterized protein LOC129001856 [Macrosteles quadrilineatus]